MTNNIYEIWVNDPSTNQQINVAPFLDVLNAFDRTKNEPLATGGAMLIQQVIRLVGRTLHEESIITPKELANLNDDLYRLEDMFRATTQKLIDNGTNETNLADNQEVVTE